MKPVEGAVTKLRLWSAIAIVAVLSVLVGPFQRDEGAVSAEGVMQVLRSDLPRPAVNLRAGS